MIPLVTLLALYLFRPGYSLFTSKVRLPRNQYANLAVQISTQEPLGLGYCTEEYVPKETMPGGQPDQRYYVVEISTHEPSGLKIHGTEDGGHYFLLEHNCIELPKHHKEVYVMEDALSHEVCQEIIDKAEAHQWTEQRHTAFATTDLPLEALFGTFSNIHADIDCRILPRMAQAFDLDEEFLQIGEIFIAKYEFNKAVESSINANVDAAKFGIEEARSETQVGLGAHKDGTPWSFVLPLNDAIEFEGGGTYFVDSEETFRPSQGSAVLFSGKNEHKGVPITGGKRFVMVGFINYSNRKDTSHEEFLRCYVKERDGCAASCISSVALHADDFSGETGSAGISLGGVGGIHTGDRLCGIIEEDVVTMLDKGTFAERADIQERLLASSKQGREGVLKFVIERDEECDQRHHVKKNCFRLLASQNYWELDAYLHYNA